MGTRLSPHDAELYARVDEVLHYVWDPIGVAGMPAARDEYHGYLPTVFSLLTQADDGGEKLVAYLVFVVTDRMGLHETKEHARDIVDVLQEWKQNLDEKYAQNP